VSEAPSDRLAVLGFCQRERADRPQAGSKVIYKVTTLFKVGSFTNPVVLSNLAIATLHLVTLVLIYRQLGLHRPHRV
jgi:hypothetical protein